MFCKKLTRAVQLDAATAQIVSGDFAEDAILAKAEQLAKHEVLDMSNNLLYAFSLTYMKEPVINVIPACCYHRRRA